MASRELYYFLILLIVGNIGIFFGIKYFKTSSKPVEYILGYLYIYSMLSFGFGLLTHTHSYFEAIKTGVDFECYSPFSFKNSLTLILYLILFNIAILAIWKKGNKLPPLTLVILLVFLLIGSILSFVIIIQVSEHDTSGIDVYNGSPGDSENKIFFFFYPFLSILISLFLVGNTVRNENIGNQEKVYANKTLNSLNQFIKKTNSLPLTFLAFLFPIIFILTLVLILFGQDVDSIYKVFTETTLWKFSQQQHPQALPHHGHYLCTVAATGEPKIVKPLRLGKRGGVIIIVNRQLLISNAFEEMVQDFSPKIHKIIRYNYDTYGYDLSKKINTTSLSNLTYLLMKPLEWIFLICLYLCCVCPEQKINRQYSL